MTAIGFAPINGNFCVRELCDLHSFVMSCFLPFSGAEMLILQGVHLVIGVEKVGVCHVLL